jgi:hypothetical protein
VWHVSLSLPQATRPLVTDKWTRQQRNEAERQARKLLAGVGGPVEMPGLYPFAYHLRRGLTDEEIAGLDQAWCALPAIDEGGTPEEVREALIAAGILEDTRT